jgi:hypothetical protein
LKNETRLLRNRHDNPQTRQPNREEAVEIARYGGDWGISDGNGQISGLR